MPKLSTKVPKFCCHVSGQAFAKLAGRQIWLGKHGEPAAREKYDRLVAEWLANARRLPVPPAAPASAATPTLHDILAPYWRWAKDRYTAAEVDTIKSALRIVERLYGSTAAAQFGPNALRAVRAEMVRKGWTRKQINRQVSRVRALFRWAASHELLPESIYAQVRTVEPLRRGEAPERPKVKPVPRRLIRAIRRRVPLQVRALIDLQLLTAARADELVGLRVSDIDRRRAVWAYNPADHKTAHHEKERWIYFGPKAQRILKLFLTPGRGETCFLFCPIESEKARYAMAKIHRRPNQKSNPPKTSRTLGKHYTTSSYRRAIHRAVAQAFPVPQEIKKAEDRLTWRRSHTWGPHRQRHTAATFLRREFGIEVAQAILGHSSFVTTLIYAERDERRAIRAIAKAG